MEREMSDTKTVMMPRELTAENGAKALLIGEFEESIILPCPRCDGEGGKTKKAVKSAMNAAALVPILRLCQ